MIRLASSSITRAELLSAAGIPYLQESVDFDEDSILASSPKNFVYQATLGKYRVNLEKFGCTDYPLLVADTVVTAQGKILRKAKDEADARAILATQSGTETDIITCMISCETQSPPIEYIPSTATIVRFPCERISSFSNTLASLCGKKRTSPSHIRDPATPLA